EAVTTTTITGSRPSRACKLLNREVASSGVQFASVMRVTHVDPFELSNARFRNTSPFACSCSLAFRDRDSPRNRVDASRCDGHRHLGPESGARSCRLQAFVR